MTTTITSAEVQGIVIGLQTMGDQMEDAADPRWLKIAQAAALLEGLRLGITEITSGGLPARWVGIDTEKPGKDTPAIDWRARHA